MYKAAIKEEVFPYRKDGNIYCNEIDWDIELRLERCDMKKAVEDKFKDESSPIYEDEEFQILFREIFYEKGGIQKILNADIKYKTQILLILLQYGSYEFISENPIVFKNSTLEEKEALLRELDERIVNIQLALIDEYEENGSSNSHKLLKIYENYLSSFALPRLSTFRKSSINFNVLVNIQKLNEIIPESEDNLSLKLEVEDILKIISLYNDLNNVDSVENVEIIENYLIQIDDIISRSIYITGINLPVLNFANCFCKNTLEKIADNIPERIMTCGIDKKYVSEEVSVLVRILNDTALENSNSNIIFDYGSRMLYISKIVQILDLKILSEEDEKKLEEALDNLLDRKNIKIPDMEQYDDNISQGNAMDENTANDFFRDVVTIYLKNGIMPVKYNEYLIAQLLEKNSVFNRILDDNQKLIIMENFAKIKYKELIDSNVYITYVNKPIAERIKGMNVEVGSCCNNFVNLNPKICSDQIMNSIINIITIFHELRHVQQQRSMKESECNHLTYMMAKERAIKNLDEGFYTRNYDYMYEELDAEYFALKNTKMFFDTLNLSNFKDDEQYKIIMDYIKKKILEVEERFLTAKNKKGEDGNSIQIEEFLDKKIKEDPLILKKNPLLRIEYNSDGSRKTEKQIFEELIIVCREKNNRLGNYDLYKYLLLSRVGKNLEQCLEIADVEIPEDLSYASRKALQTLKHMIIDRCIEKMEDKEDEILPGQMDGKYELDKTLIEKFEKADEKMTPNMREKYDSILGDEEK